MVQSCKQGRDKWPGAAGAGSPLTGWTLGWGAGQRKRQPGCKEAWIGAAMRRGGVQRLSAAGQCG